MRARLIDEFGMLKTEMDTWRPQTTLTCGDVIGFEAAKKHCDDLSREIKAPYETCAPKQSFVEAGHRFQVQISARRKEWLYLPGALRKLARLLKEKFWDAVQFPTSQFEEQVPEAARARYAVKDQTGYRTLKLTPIAQPPAAIKEPEPEA